MRCLYCGKRLALLKKLSDGDFCSVAHRRKYQAEQEQLVVARLAENDEHIAKANGEGGSPAPTRRARTRPTGDPVRFGVYLAEEPDARSLRTNIRNSSDHLPQTARASLPVLENVAVEVAPLPEQPVEALPEPENVLSEPVMALAEPAQERFLEPHSLSAPVELPLTLRTFAPDFQNSAVGPLPLSGPAISFVPLAATIPALRPDLAPITRTDYGIDASPGETGIAVKAMAAPFRPPRWARKPIVRRTAPGVQPVTPNELVAAPRLDAVGQYPTIRDCGSYPSRLFAQIPTAQKPYSAGVLPTETGAKCEPGLVPAPLMNPVNDLAIEQRHALDAPAWTVFPAKLAVRRLKRKLAGGTTLPAGAEVPVPALGGVNVAYQIKQHGVTAPFWPSLLPSRPRLHLTFKPFAEEYNRLFSSLDIGRSGVKQPRQSWEPLVQLWRSAPADLKWLALALPLIFIFVVQSRHNGMVQKNAAAAPIVVAPGNAPGVGVVQTASQSGMATSTPLPAATALPAAAMPGSAPAAGFRGAMAVRFQNLQKIMASRAAVELSDDFRFGLNSWTGRKDWAKTWSYDAGGSVSTGALALYKPTTSLVDYRMEFLGCIDKKAIGWVFRAKDAENYYALKLVITKPGPLPIAAIERFAVIDGKETQHFQIPLPLTVRNDSLYRIRTEVNGSDFTTSVQGQVVDHFTDDRLKIGGVGFFSIRGEQARLRWVEVSHQYDMLGQFFAMITPYDPQAKSDLGDR